MGTDELPSIEVLSQQRLCVVCARLTTGLNREETGKVFMCEVNGWEISDPYRTTCWENFEQNTEMLEKLPALLEQSKAKPLSSR